MYNISNFEKISTFIMKLMFTCKNTQVKNFIPGVTWVYIILINFDKIKKIF